MEWELTIDSVIENGQILVFLMTKNIHGYDVH